ncbi:probable serine/threonine-protein kinase DDB_G0271682 isoform X2 [Dysidea avara]
MSTGNELGRGSYGKVYSVQYRNKTYAAKEIHRLLIEGVSPEDREAIKNDFVKECLRCSSIYHSNVVEFVGVYYSDHSGIPIMVMELMETSLASFVKKNKSNIANKKKISILFDVSCGLTFLHTRKPPVIHRDLSSNNVMLTSKLVAKLGDLGVAKVIRADRTQTKSRLTTAPGTTDFMPPETLVANPEYGFPVDVFSFAGVALHVFSEEWPSPGPTKAKDPETGKYFAPTEAGRRQQYLDKITGGDLVTTLRQLVERCLDDDPDKRPPIREVKKTIEPMVESPPLAEALQTKQYHLEWDTCADLPSRMYNASVAVNGNNVYVTAGGALEDETKNNVYHYNIATNQWITLPPPGHYKGVLCMVDALSIFGGCDSVTYKTLRKVSTYDRDSNGWLQTYPGLIHKRFLPGVVVHGEHLMVMGGEDQSRKSLDSIEIMDWRQRSPWREVSFKLPVPMKHIKPSISGEHLLIVGYEQGVTRYNGSYQLPVATVTSLSSSSDQVASQWEELSSAPHFHTAIVPHSNPPLIIGGSDVKGVPTSDISLYDTLKKSWIQVDTLIIAKKNIGVANINSKTIIVIGGTSGGKGVEANKAVSLPIVEIGHIVHN